MHPPYFQKSNTFTPLTKSRTSSCILELLSLVQHIYWHSNPPPPLCCMLVISIHKLRVSPSPPAGSQSQAAVSLHCHTGVIQGQPLDGAAQRRVLGLVHGIHALRDGENKRPSALYERGRIHLLGKHLLYERVKQRALKGFHVWLHAQWLCCGSQPVLSYATSTLAPRIPFEYGLMWEERATGEEGGSYRQTPWAWQV